MAPRTPGGFFVALKQTALTKAARFYVYGSGRVSKETFDDPFFREMLQGYFTAGGGKGKCPILTRRGLRSYITAEFRNFRELAKFTAKKARVSAEGNAFGQSLHDCATLASHDHILAIGFNYVDVDLENNWTICLACTPIGDGTDSGVALVLEDVFIDMLGYSHADLAHSTTSYRAAMGVVENTYACGMHDTDKVGRSMIGDLVRSRKKVSRELEVDRAHAKEVPGGPAFVHRRCGSGREDREQRR